MEELEDGKDSNLPHHITLQYFAAARMREIQVMNKNLSTSTAVKLAFQKLPRHMRRRAMSHNVKRLPRRLCEIHSNQQMKSGLPPKAKRPSRKYRRRPYNLTSEYVRRQRRITWLNTHIWHAKRFHMVDKWGYRIAYSACDRAFRACYRATAKHCLIQDISYISCIEIVGEFNHICDFFKRITDLNVGLSIYAKPYIRGFREGNIMIFRPDNRKAVGKVDFIWKPGTATTRTLWLWCHASYYKELLDIFTNCMDFKPTIDDESNTFRNNNLLMKLLKWDLSRFRLTGPLSTAVLQNALKLADMTSKGTWVQSFVKNTTSHDYWGKLKCMSAPSEVSPHIVLPLIITDPRYNFPKKRTKSLPIESFDFVDVPVVDNFLESPIWDDDVRKIVQESKVSNAKLAEMRHKLLVPGTDLEEPPVALPIILIQRPGVKRSEYRGYGSGWDIILPSSWAQPLWLCLIMWGGRSGGLRETDNIVFESGYQHYLYPDTLSGETEENEVSNKMKETYFKLPPNKRTNFAKFKITSPFDFNWKLLLKEWSSSNELNDFFVLRDKKLLNNLQEKLKSKNVEVNLPDNVLIPVQITVLKKGRCKRFSIICLPQVGDLKAEPVEPNCVDPNELRRKALRKEHKVLLKRLKRKRKLKRKEGEKIPIDKDMLMNYTKTMRKLWLPDTTSIRNSCAREVMGFIKHGDFSFVNAKSKGIGYVTSNAFIKLLETNNNRVLVRNVNSKQYRLGTLEVICD